jgi:wobble nucleotide-excising tRNase
MNREGRSLSPLFFVAVPDEKDKTRAAGARESLSIEVMSTVEGEDRESRPTRIFTFSAMVVDGLVTIVASTERNGKCVDRINFMHDTRGFQNGK